MSTEALTNLLTKIILETATAEDFLGIGYVKLASSFIYGPGNVILKGFGYKVKATSHDTFIYRDKINFSLYRIISDDSTNEVGTIYFRDKVIYGSK